MIIIKEGDSGSYVYMVQLALKRAGFYDILIDGIFGGQTKAALTQFQKQAGITPDGIVGKNTMEKLLPLIRGYAIHRIVKGDTLYKLAEKYNSSVESIKNANPNISANNLSVGQNIIIPLNFNLVAEKVEYNTFLTEQILKGLSARYPFITLYSVGKSVLDSPITMLKIGRGERKVFFNASHHANEWITTPLVLKFIEQFAKGVANTELANGVNWEELFSKNTLYVVPLVNPDGVDLVTGAIIKDGEEYLDALTLAENYPNIPFPSGWKANINGVDLNLNYPAMWERAKELKFEAGFTVPGPRDYVGAFPLSEPESRAIYDISEKIGFDITLSFHTQGEEIYWKFADLEPENAFAIGQEMARRSGYILAETAEFSSYAGYKDWFIMKYLLPGYTIEAGRGRNPLPISQFSSIYENVFGIMLTALQTDL